MECPYCGEDIPESLIDAGMEKALGYAHDVGFDEGYESAEEEMNERVTCEMYVVPEGYQCGNCGAINELIPAVCTCGSRVVWIIDEGVANDG